MVTYISQKRIFSKWITLHSVQSMKSNSTLQVFHCYYFVLFEKYLHSHLIFNIKLNKLQLSITCLHMDAQIQVPVNTSTGFALLSGDISKNLFRDDCTPSNTIPQKSKPVVCCIPTNINAPMVCTFRIHES